jgi:predicted transcriptional regulator
MVDTELLQEEMRSRGYTLERIALELGRSRTCVFNKIHNKSEFRASEVNKIARVLRLSKAQTNRIFFA